MRSRDSKCQTLDKGSDLQSLSLHLPPKSKRVKETQTEESFYDSQIFYEEMNLLVDSAFIDKIQLIISPQ